MQMTMMVPPSFTKEAHYLNKEDRLLRWFVVKHRDAVYRLEFINEDDEKYEMGSFRPNSSSVKDELNMRTLMNMTTMRMTSKRSSKSRFLCQEISALSVLGDIFSCKLYVLLYQFFDDKVGQEVEPLNLTVCQRRSLNT
jgi:hypothetical protein